MSHGIRIPPPSIAAHTLRVTGTVNVRSLRPDSESEPTNSAPPDGPQPTSLTTFNPRHAKLQHSLDVLKSLMDEKQTQYQKNLEDLRQIDPSSELENNDETLLRAQHIVASHIKLLHRYNEIKDIGLGLMGLIADREGKRLGDVMKERDVCDDD